MNKLVSVCTPLLLLATASRQCASQQPRAIIGLIASVKSPVELRDAQVHKTIMLDAAKSRWRPLLEGQSFRCVRKGAEITIDFPSGNSQRIVYETRRHARGSHKLVEPKTWITPSDSSTKSVTSRSIANDKNGRDDQQQQQRYRQQVYQEKTRLGGLERISSDAVLFCPADGSTLREDHVSIRWNPFTTYKASVHLDLLDSRGNIIGPPIIVNSNTGVIDPSDIQLRIRSQADLGNLVFQLRLYDGAELKGTSEFTVLARNNAVEVSDAIAGVDGTLSPADTCVIRAAILREHNLLNEAADQYASMVTLPGIDHSPYALYRAYVEQLRIGNIVLAKQLARTLPPDILLPAN